MFVPRISSAGNPGSTPSWSPSRWLSSTRCLLRQKRSGGRGASARTRSVRTAKESTPTERDAPRWSVRRESGLRETPPRRTRATRSSQSKKNTTQRRTSAQPSRRSPVAKRPGQCSCPASSRVSRCRLCSSLSSQVSFCSLQTQIGQPSEPPQRQTQHTVWQVGKQDKQELSHLQVRITVSHSRFHMCDDAALSF